MATRLQTESEGESEIDLADHQNVLTSREMVMFLNTVEQRMRDYGHTGSAVQSARMAAGYALSKLSEARDIAATRAKA